MLQLGYQYYQNTHLCNRPGRPALARVGEFWYPVRLIQKKGDLWIVRWWRGCEFIKDGIQPQTVTMILSSEIVDSLWLKRLERRQIRVSCASTLLHN